MKKKRMQKEIVMTKIAVLTMLLLIIPLILILLFPIISLADADKIFKENNKAVVVVVVYDQRGKPISQGSGFIVREDGAIVTNYHVISNAKNIRIKASDKILDVEGLLHIDKENDLVILKVKGKNLPTLKIGDIGKMNVGDKVYVISSPQGLENTISDGILSGIREIDQKRKILQITAPVSEGSSGGPVFNKNGEVIGIATFIIESAQNLNFAMPVNLIKDKIESKKVTALKDAVIIDYTKTAEYYFNLGYYYGEAGMYRESINAFKQFIRIKPDDALAHNNLGVAYHRLGMNREAIEAYKQAIRIKPDEALAHYNLGITYVDLGMYRESVKAYKQAIRIKPDYAKAHNNLGIAYHRLGMNREAIEAYKQAIRIKPDEAFAHNNLGATYGKLGMYREEIESYKQAIRIKPDEAFAHYNLGLPYEKLGMYREAIEAYKQAIRIEPDDADAHYNLGVTYLVLNDRGSALEEYKILKDLNPELANKLFNLIYK